MDFITEEAIEAHEEIVANWDGKPTFIKKRKGDFGLFFYVKDDEAGQHWKWANYGTGKYAGNPEYDIVPKKPGGVLSFNLGYSPRTTRRSHGGPGTASGPRVFARSVHREGNIDRRYDRLVFKMMMKKHAKKFVKFLAKAL